MESRINTAQTRATVHAAPEGLQYDVLVIGGAATGLVAAIEARARGASVLVVSKSKAGRSGNTVVASGQFCAVVPHEGGEDSSEQHFRDTLASGKGINDEDLLRIFATGAGAQVVKLEEWGARLTRADGELVRRHPPGHRFPRGIPVDASAYPISLSGMAITVPLRDTAERMGVRFLDGMPVVRLIRQEAEVCGALAIDLGTGQLVLIRARAVVVAAGGGGHLYADTNNTRGITGDSYGLLLQAGAALRDMEFVQFFPVQMVKPFKAPGPIAMFGDGAVLRNRHGERFMPLYDPVNADKATRDLMAQAIFAEIQKGNGIDGEVYMDCTQLPESTLLKKYPSVVRDLRKGGVDLTRDWLRVGIATHFFMGGAIVDGACRTGVPGLFAAGEAVGGVHGANRLAGNALTETVVFGAIAGQAAAEFVSHRASVPEPSSSSVVLEREGEGSESLDAVRSEMRKAMAAGAGVVRTEASLRSTLSTVRACAEAVERCPAPTPSMAARREETRLMCLAAEAVVLSALARQESRGAHFRSDFPKEDSQWVGSHRVRLKDSALQMEFVPKA